MQADAAARMPDGLRRNDALFRAISDASPLGISVSDVAGACVYTNPAYQKISGLAPEQALGSNWSKALHPEDRPRVVAEWRDVARKQQLFQAEVRFLRGDLSVVWTRLNATPLWDGGVLSGYVQTIEDISERKKLESVLRTAEALIYEEKERAEITLNSIGDAVVTTDSAGRVRYLNPAAESMTGWSRLNALGRPLTEVIPMVDGDTRVVAMNSALRAIAGNRPLGLAANSVLVRRDGIELAIEDSVAPIHDRDGTVTGAVIVFRDVSKARAIAERMAYLAQHDVLTNLANRALLTERLGQAIGLARRHKKQLALLFLDLDGFKGINDALGHAVGDQLLKQVAGRLVTCVRSTDTVCRQGGDEFVILLAEIAQRQDAATIAEKLLAMLAEPQDVNQQPVRVTLSIGISIYPDDSHDVDSAMRNADTAMYQAKEAGRNTYKFFQANMGMPSARRMYTDRGQEAG